MTDATRQMLFRAILAEPEADDVRLIYADWLQDHGDPERAEFIRVQVRLATLDDDDPDWPALKEREQDLLDEHRRRWLAELPAGLCKVDDYSPKFQRGFPCAPEVECATFLARGDELFEALPVDLLRVREIGKRIPTPAGASREEILASLTAAMRGNNAPRVGLSEGVAALADCPRLARVRRLCISLNNLEPDHLEILLGSRYLRDIEELDLGNKLGPRGAELVARWPGAASLRTLSFFFASIGPNGMAALAASPSLGNLRRLQLHGCGIGTAGVRALVRSATLTQLTDLSLGYNQIDTEGIRLLAGWPQFARLERFSVGYNGPRNDGPGDVGLAVLAASPYLPTLRTLDLRESNVGPVGAGTLADWPAAATLRVLDLTQNALGDEGVRRLAGSTRLGSLRWLTLDRVGMGDEGARALAAAPTLRPVTLNLSHNALGLDGITALADGAFLEQVADLDLSEVPLGDPGLTALARGRGLRRPMNVRVFKCGLGPEALNALVAADWVAGLRELEVSVNPLGAGGVALARLPLGLRKLSLGSTEVGDETAVALANWPGAASLRDLSIGHNNLTDAGLQALANSPYLGRLNHLVIWNKDITTTGLEPLWARFGDNVYPQRRQWEKQK